MILEQALYERMTAFAGLTALVSTRVYPSRAPQNATYPLVVYQRISGEHGEVMEGSDGLGMARVQFLAWATTYASAKAVAEQVRLALQSRVGSLSGLAVTVVEAADIPDFWDDTSDIHGAGIDFTIYYEETQPS